MATSLDQPTEYDRLSDLEKTALQAWIQSSIRPAGRYNASTSYGLKHRFEAVGFYITNGAFKGAMVAAGYKPRDETAHNWQFKIKVLPTVTPTEQAGFDDLVKLVKTSWQANG